MERTADVRTEHVFQMLGIVLPVLMSAQTSVIVDPSKLHVVNLSL
jgi:hypothetical protein